MSFVNIGSGPTDWDWVYATYHSSIPDTINRPHVDDPFVDSVLDEWVNASDARQLEIQSELFVYLGDQMYRIHTMVPPHYAIAQSYLVRVGNPYCWLPGFCSYGAKTTWMTGDNIPDRKFEKFGEWTHRQDDGRMPPLRKRGHSPINSPWLFITAMDRSSFTY